MKSKDFYMSFKSEKYFVRFPNFRNTKHIATTQDSDSIFGMNRKSVVDLSKYIS